VPPVKIKGNNRESVLASADATEVLEGSMEQLYDEAAMAVANIPDLELCVSGIHANLFQSANDMQLEINPPFADTDEDVFAFLGEVCHQHTEGDKPLGLGCLWDDPGALLYS